jgi:hypothetical protein
MMARPRNDRDAMLSKLEVVRSRIPRLPPQRSVLAPISACSLLIPRQLQSFIAFSNSERGGLTVVLPECVSAAWTSVLPNGPQGTLIDTGGDLQK